VPEVQRFKLAVANHVETLLNRDEDDAWDKFPDADEGDDYNDARWNWVVENLSVLADEPFINTYVKMRYNAPVKEPFPEALFEDCQRVYDIWVAKGNEGPEGQVCVVLRLDTFNIVSLCIFLFTGAHGYSGSQRQDSPLDPWRCPQVRCIREDAKELL